MWDIRFDFATKQVSLEPVRNLEAHFDITEYLVPPACDDCVSINVNSFDPVTRILDADVILRNPYDLAGFDVRGILFTNTFGHLLQNPDGWTDLWDIPGGESLNPFRAFPGESTDGSFGPGEARTENYIVYIPKPPSYTGITFAVDASWPGNCKEPYAIENFSCGILYDAPQQSAHAEVDVLDWQDDVEQVVIVAPDITGQEFFEFTHADANTWETEIINNNGAVAGEYEARIVATSAGTGATALQYFVTITVTEAGTPTVTTIEPDTVVAGTPVEAAVVTGTGFAGPGSVVKLTAHDAEDIFAVNVETIDPTTITCDFNIPVSAHPGIYDVEVTNEFSKAGIGTELITIEPPPPLVQEINPDTGEAGTYIENVNVSGQYFADPGIEVSLKPQTGDEIHALNVIVANSTSILCDLDIPIGAPPGGYDVEVTNSDGKSGLAEDIFWISGPPPQVSGIDPQSTDAGVILDNVTITGSYFAGPVIQVKLKAAAAPDIVGADVILVSSTAITCDFNIPINAHTGLYDVEIINGDGKSGTGIGLFEILPPPPSVTGINPGQGETGTDLDGVTISGNYFTGPGALVKLRQDGEPDITATNVSVINASTITCDISIPLSVEDGAYDVEITNPGGKSGTGTALFVVFGVDPVVTSINPDHGNRGQSYPGVIVSGANFKGPGAQVFLKKSGYPNLPATNVTVLNENTIQCDFSIPLSAPTGWVDVEVINGDMKSGTGISLFEVQNPPPSVSGINPDSAEIGTNLNGVIVTGTNFFGPGAGVRLTQPAAADIVATSVVVVSSTTITCNINIPFTPDLGFYDVEVTNGDGKSAIGPDLFHILCATPSITQVDPDSAHNNVGVVEVTITGEKFTGTEHEADLRLRREGHPDIIGDITSYSLNSLTADFNLTGAEHGAWDVVLTNGCGTETSKIDGFTILAPPVIESVELSRTTTLNASYNERVTLTVQASDPDSVDDFTYHWTSPTGTFLTNDAESVEWVSPNAVGHSYITVRVTDPEGGYTENADTFIRVTQYPTGAYPAGFDEALPAPAWTLQRLPDHELVSLSDYSPGNVVYLNFWMTT